MSGIKVLKATVTTVVIALLCLLPPVIHFVTGPLSPLIGGYIAGNRFQLNSGECALVGLVLALVVGAPVPWIFRVTGALPDLELGAYVFFSVVGALWFGILGGAAALAGAHSTVEKGIPPIQ